MSVGSQPARLSMLIERKRGPSYVPVTVTERSRIAIARFRALYAMASVKQDAIDARNNSVGCGPQLVPATLSGSSTAKSPAFTSQRRPPCQVLSTERWPVTDDLDDHDPG